MISTFLNISINNDDIFEGNETFSITIIGSRLPNRVSVSKIRKAVVTIIDIGKLLVQH